MADHVLRLFLDRFASKTRLEAPLPAALRYIYVAEGMATLRAGGGVSTLTADSGWFHDATSHVGAAGDGAVLLRWELTCDPEPDDGVATGSGVDSRRLLDARLELDDADGYLLRGDKVELPPGGVAYDTHTPVVAYVAWCRVGSSLRRAELSTATSNTNPGSKPDPIRCAPGRRHPNRAISPAS